MRRMPNFKGEVKEYHPAFSPDSAARVREFPTDEDLEEMRSTKIEYTPEDEKVMGEFLKTNVFSVWHWLGTCSMKPREDGGVVDAGLNVYGVQGLKVAG